MLRFWNIEGQRKGEYTCSDQEPLSRLLLECSQPPYWESSSTAGSRRLFSLAPADDSYAQSNQHNSEYHHRRRRRAGRHIHEADVRSPRKTRSGVHTFGMAFSIDVVGLDSDLKVVKLWRCLRPFRITSVSMKLKSVIELPCGVITQSQMQLGDQLHIAPSSPANETL